MTKIKFLGNELEPFLDTNQNQQKESIFNSYFKHYLFLNNEAFYIKTGFSKGRLEIEIELKSETEHFYYPIQLVFLTDLNKQELQTQSEVLFDYTMSYWSEYFSNDRDVFIPIDWQAFEIEGVEFFIRGSFRHLNLEKLADEYLIEHGNGSYEILPISMET